jgi:hypothetical protein
MFLINQNTCGTEQNPAMTFTLAGSTGNVYQIDIRTLSACRCFGAIAMERELIYYWQALVLITPRDIRMFLT